jgi:glycosyltransferase involved in cell wall biosynthesis
MIPGDANPQANPRIVLVSSLGYGGATIYALNLARGLRELGIPNLIVSPEKDHPFHKDFERYGISVALADHTQLIYEDRMAYMLKAISDFHPTAVIGCIGPMSYEVLRHLNPGVKRMALVHTDHTIFYEAVKPYSPWIDTIFGVSQAIVENFGKSKEFFATRRFQLPCGVEIPNMTQRVVSGNHPIRILYLGRLVEPQKRVRLFPTILEHLRSSGLPFRWSIAGEGPELEFLKNAMTGGSEDQQVCFLGNIPNSRVPEFLREQDIYLLASDTEGLPVSLLEAMASGVVPVTSDLESGLSELVNETTGILVPPLQTSGYAEAIIRLANNREELRQKSLRCVDKIRERHSLRASATSLLQACPPYENKGEPTICDAPVQPPLGATSLWKFTPPLRWSRRVMKRLSAPKNHLL